MTENRLLLYLNSRVEYVMNSHKAHKEHREGDGGNSLYGLYALYGSIYLLPVIEKAHALGLYVITCDYLPHNAAHPFALARRGDIVL